MRRCLASVAICTVLCGCGSTHATDGATSRQIEIAKAEEFVDAFYSFDANALANVLDGAASTKPEILHYQGWARGGNCKIMNRKPCMPEGADSIACSITVDDDLITALGITSDVTDTFHLTFSGGQVSAVETSSDDPPEFHQAEAWVRGNRPQLFEVPCPGYFAGGPTPGECVKAMVQGFREFAKHG
jgi:hypothetical protein